MTCVWDADPACLPDSWAAADPADKARALDLATSTLIMLTNNRVGTCPVTIRPCPRVSRCGCEWSPHIRDGVWVNGCAHRTECAPLSEIDLPGPVGYLVGMKVDGVGIDLFDGNWRLDDGHLLVWQGGGTSPVPDYQNLSLPDSAAGTWSVTYSQSYQPGPQGRVAVALLAAQYLEACKPKGKCDLPKGVRTVTRAGVSFTIDAGLFPNGETGIEMVDVFIRKWAPSGSPRRAAVVFDPRKSGPRRTNAVPLKRVVP